LAYDGSLNFDTKIDTNGFAKGTNTIKAQSNGLKSVLGSLGKAMIAAFSITALVAFGKQAVSIASDLIEVQNVVDTAFGEMSYKIEDFSDTAIEKFGISELTAKSMASTFMAMGKGIGQSMGVGSDMAVELTGRLADVMSFYNKTAGEVDTIGRALYSGETEPLKAIGIIMTQTNLDAYTLAKGYGTLYTKMDAANQLLVRQKYFLEQTSMAAGDFQKTQDSWANQTRILSERWKEFMGIIGGQLITLLTPVLKFLNSFVSTLINFANTISSIMSNVFGIQMQQITATTSAYDSMADSATNAGIAESGVADATKEAGKAAKGSVSSFDKLNNTQDSTGSGSSGGSGGGAATSTGAISTAPVENTNDAMGKANALTKAWYAELKKISDLFLTGFSIGFGDYEPKIQSIKTSLGSIGKSLKEIFTDPVVVNSAKKYFDSLVLNAGKIAGSFASIGLTIAQNLVGGIALYLKQNTQQIKSYLIQMFDIQADVFTILGTLSTSIAYIFGAMGTNAGQQMTANFIGVFSSAFMGLTLLASTIGLDLLSALTQPFIDGKETLRQTFEDILSNMSDGLGFIKTTVDEVFKTFQTLYITYIQPVIQSFGDRWSELVTGKLAPMFKTLSQLFRELASLVKTLWETLIYPTIQKFAPTFTVVFSAVGNIIMTTVETMSDLITGFVTVLKGVIKFINGVFSGDWKKAWEGIADIFGGAWKMLVTLLKTPFKAIIDMINAMIDGVVGGVNTLINALKAISIDVPDWFTEKTGIGDLGFGGLNTIKATHIPQLATGTVVPANYGSFLSILGDNKREPEIVSPLSTMKQAIREEVGSDGTKMLHVTIMLPNGKVLFDAVVEAEKENFNATGNAAFVH